MNENQEEANLTTFVAPPVPDRHPQLHPKFEHNWDLNPGQARHVQDSLRELVRIKPLPLKNVRRVAGVDASYREKAVCGTAVVVELPTLRTLEQTAAELSLTFPYVPGLLSFREGPAILTAVEQLSTLPDVLIVDGHGQAHPRFFGLACHLGVLLNLPVIGCAKSVLIGNVQPLGNPVGSRADIILDGQVIGAALRTRLNVKPAYLSIGHLVDLESAAQIVLACGKGFRLPEPIRRAHFLAKEVCKSMKQD
jgi:deoxyribonuclease V